MALAPLEVPSMAGKTCLVTGATSGIGAVTAEALARAGASVVVVGRDPSRCEATAARLRTLSGGAAVEAVAADLSRQAEVRRLASVVRARVPRLDVLVNNAGAAFRTREESGDGVEMTWALNHLAYFLLTQELAPLLRASAPARVVNVASDAHRMVSGIDFDDPEYRSRSFRSWPAYAQSKLANILFTRELARRLEGTGVTANSLHPGFVATSFFANKGRRFGLLGAAARLVALSPEAGARTSIYLATSPEVAGVSGRYFQKCRAVEPARPATDDQAAARLWDVSAAMTAGAAHV